MSHLFEHKLKIKQRLEAGTNANGSVDVHVTTCTSCKMAVCTYRYNHSDLFQSDNLHNMR